VYVADARPWLASHALRYDLVQVDLYQGGPYTPFYLITEEFLSKSFTDCRGRPVDDECL